MSQFRINKESPIPLYFQVRESLRQQINKGLYAPESQLPAESQIGILFGVSRITVRQALSELEREGLIFKVPSKGTFVARVKPYQELSQLEGFSEALTRHGHQVFNQVLSHATIPASHTAANRLHLPAERSVTEIKRARYVDREPISYEVTYLPKQIGERLRSENLAQRDIFSILEDDYHIGLGHADIRISAVAAETEQALALRVDEGTALLRIERLTYDRDGKPLEFEYLYFRGDAFHYRLQIPRQATVTPPLTRL